jgi:hypothetical protein
MRGITTATMLTCWSCCCAIASPPQFEIEREFERSLTANAISRTNPIAVLNGFINLASPWQFATNITFSGEQYELRVTKLDVDVVKNVSFPSDRRDVAGLTFEYRPVNKSLRFTNTMLAGCAYFSTGALAKKWFHFGSLNYQVEYYPHGGIFNQCLGDKTRDMYWSGFFDAAGALQAIAASTPEGIGLDHKYWNGSAGEISQPQYQRIIDDLFSQRNQSFQQSHGP